MEDEKEVKVIENNFPSKPILSPSNDKIAYISPDEWETISKLYLFNLKNGKKRLLIDPIDGESIPKEILWINNSTLAIIMGYGYGTVAVGGNVMLFDIIKNKTKYLTKYTPEIQATQILLAEKNVLQIKGIEYIDENFVSTREFLDVMKITEI
ncbi:DUF4652 domain-containing protein [Oceanobacillus sp. FSL W7-1304]